MAHSFQADLLDEPVKVKIQIVSKIAPVKAGKV
jgi:hypothetical protein